MARQYSPRLRRADVAPSLELWGVRQNPLRLGLTPGRGDNTRVSDVLTRLSRNPNIRRQFSGVGRCPNCRRDTQPKRPPKVYINGAGRCLYHEWKRHELGLAGLPW